MLETLIKLFFDKTDLEVQNQLKLIICLFLWMIFFQFGSLMLQAYMQFRLKKFDTKIESGKLKANKKISTREEIYSKIQEIHRDIPGDEQYININTDKINYLRKYCSDNRLYLSNECHSLINDIIDLLILKVYQISKYDESAFIKKIKSFQKEFDEI